MRRGRRSSGYASGTSFAPFGRQQAGYPGARDYEAGGGYSQGGNPGYGSGVGTGGGSYAPPAGAPPGAPPPPYAGPNKEAGVGGFAPPPGPPPPPNAHIAQNKPSVSSNLHSARRFAERLYLHAEPLWQRVVWKQQ